MTRRFMHLVSRLWGAPALAMGVSMLLALSTSAQQPPTPPEPPQPHEADSDSSKASERDSSDESHTTQSSQNSDRSSTSRDTARSGRDRDDQSDSRSASSRDDRSKSRDNRSANRDDRSRSSRDADRSQRDRSSSEDEGDDRSASRRSDSSRDRDRSTDRDTRDRSADRDDARSFSRDTDEDHFRDRDEEADDRVSSRDRSSSRDAFDRDRGRDDRFSSRDRDDRSSARDRLRDDVRDTARDVRDTVRDARDTARDTVRDARSTARNVRDSVSRSSRQEFDVQTARAADIGLWFNRSTSNGLVISDVATSGPIARLGFREGDRIISVDGYRVGSERQFVQDLFYDDIRNQRVPVVVYRNGAQQTIYVEPTTLVEHYTVSQHDPLEKFGLVLDDRYHDRLVVWKTIPRTPAYYAGIRKGDVITTWDTTRVTRQDQLVRLVEQAAESGDAEVRLTVYRGQQPRQLDVEFAEVATRVDRRTSYRPALEQESSTFTESYPAVEGTRPGVIDRPRIVPRPGILPRNR